MKTDYYRRENQVAKNDAAGKIKADAEKRFYAQHQKIEQLNRQMKDLYSRKDEDVNKLKPYIKKVLSSVDEIWDLGIKTPLKDYRFWTCLNNPSPYTIKRNIESLFFDWEHIIWQDVRGEADRMYSQAIESFSKNSIMLSSRNAVVNRALAWKQGGEVAKNADDGAKVRVVAETETLFGKRREEKTMTVGELRAAMTRLGHGRLFADVVRDAEAGKDANPLLKLPCEAWITLA